MPVHRPHSHSKRTGLARALSKLGFCSRSEAREYIFRNRVRVNGSPCRDPERWIDLLHDRIEIDSQPLEAARNIYLMLNKPRGLVTSASDERGRPTVYQCLRDEPLPKLSPVGRLDMASEGLLLLTNDTAWANRVASPETHLAKVYHVQVNCIADEQLVRRMEQGQAIEGEFLAATRVTILRCGSRNSWLEVVLTEGKNRHIRRLLAAFEVEVLRLIRIRIGPLALGQLAKGTFRYLTEQEVLALASS
jgi:23S rRNA pseudouridine2605 synthase